MTSSKVSGIKMGVEQDPYQKLRDRNTERIIDKGIDSLNQGNHEASYQNLLRAIERMNLPEGQINSLKTYLKKQRATINPLYVSLMKIAKDSPEIRLEVLKDMAIEVIELEEIIKEKKSSGVLPNELELSLLDGAAKEFKQILKEYNRFFFDEC